MVVEAHGAVLARDAVARADRAPDLAGRAERRRDVDVVDGDEGRAVFARVGQEVGDGAGADGAAGERGVPVGGEDDRRRGG